LIICLHAKTLIRNASVSSASVAGVEWPSMPKPATGSAGNSMPSVRRITVTAPMPLPGELSIRCRRTPRGYHKRSLNSNGGWNRTSSLSFLNMPILAYAGEIQSAVLLVHGENAHSRYFSEDTYKKLQGDNKELLIIPGAVHTDLYDNMEKIPFDKIETFFREYLR